MREEFMFSFAASSMSKESTRPRENHHALPQAINPSPLVATQRQLGNRGMQQVARLNHTFEKPLAPRKDAVQANPPPRTSKANPDDVKITVRLPQKFSRESLLTDDPFFAPSAGLSFEFARHAKFRQDEFVTGILSWQASGAGLPESKRQEAYATFQHQWESETEDRKDLPGSPIMLKDFDSHIYGLAVVPGLTCARAGRQDKPAFDKAGSDWKFTEYGKFIDTLTFPDKEIKHAYFFEFRCRKEGDAIEGTVDYQSVGSVESY